METPPPGHKRNLLLGTLFLGVLLAVCSGNLADPPFWDAACSIFPAGLFLRSHGWSLPTLFAQPGFAAGGPNAHATSVVAWVVGLAYGVLEPGAALVALHALTLACAAAAAAWVARAAGHVVGMRLGVALGALTLLQPMVLAQTRMVYLEIPLLAATVAACTWWVEGRVVLTALALAFACLTKQTGAIAVAGVVAAELLDGTPWRGRIRRALLFLVMAVPSAWLEVWAMAAEPRGHGGPVSLWETTRGLVRGLGATLTDFFTLYGVALVLALWWLGARGVRPVSHPQPQGARVLRVFACVLGAHAAFYVLLPWVAPWANAAPRYLVQAVPSVVVLLVGSVALRAGGRLAWFTTGILGCVFAVNTQGAFYLTPGNNDGSLAERSSEYQSLLAVHRELMHRAEALPPGVPIYYPTLEHYLQAWPDMGYVRRPLPQGRLVFLEAGFTPENEAGLPDEFYMLVDFQLADRDPLNAVLMALHRDPRWRVNIELVSHAPYRAGLVHLQRVPPAP